MSVCASVCMCVWVETRWGQGSLALVLQAKQGYIMHTHHAVQEAVLAPGTGLLTQVPAIVSGPSSLLEVLLPGLNSMLVNRFLSVPWLGR